MSKPLNRLPSESDSFANMSIPAHMPHSKARKRSVDTVFTPDSVHSLPDRYFLYADEQQSPTLAIADDETIIYLKEQHEEQDGLLIVANRRGKRMQSVQNVKKNGCLVAVDFDQETERILDTSEFGDRWEGPILNGTPFGWGLRYDRNGELVYEGFSIFGKASLYGTEYDAVTHSIIYQGTFCDDCRCGRGVQYDRNGSVVYDGEWVNDTHKMDSVVRVPRSVDFLPPISSLLVSLRVDYDTCKKNRSLRLHHFPRLRELILIAHCFGNESEEGLVFSCVNCSELEVIEFLYEAALSCFNRMIVTGVNPFSA